MNLELLKGIYVPILTPVDENENVDYLRFEKHINYLIEKGVHGILAHGSNSEFYMFNEKEYEEILKFIVKVTNKRIPVVAGIGNIRTRDCIRYIEIAEKSGADAVSILQPMFLKPTETELYNHFKEIANSTKIPVLLYNNSRIGYTLTADLVEKLARTVDNIVGIKDSSGDMNQLLEFVRRTKDINFKVFSGKDTLLYSGLNIGAVGGVCSTANIFPELVTEIYESYVDGNLEKSLELQFVLNPVRLSMDKASFPVATKDMANINKMKVGKPIKPSLESNEDVLNYMKNKMKEAKLLKEEYE